MKIYAVVILFMVSCMISQGAYLGPDQSQVYDTVSDVLRSPIDDAHVSLKGRVIRKVASEHYVFKDETGEIQVEIDDKLLWNVSLTDETEVEVNGKIDRDFMRDTEVDVKVIRVISTNNVAMEAQVEMSFGSTKIASLLRNTNMNLQEVQVEGKILMFVDDDEFILSDESGAIFVDVDGPTKGMLPQLKEEDRVKVHGKVRFEQFHGQRPARAELEVHSVIKM